MLDRRASFLTAVVDRVIDLEARGGRFELLDAGRFRVAPADVLTADDRDFLREYREEARRVLDYCLNEGWRR